MATSVKILADSVSADGHRLATFELTFPRFILAELNTHRVFSRNSASSRAIPTEKHIARACEHPFVPSTFNKRVKGMGVGEAFSPADQDQAVNVWLACRDHAVEAARYLNELDVDKSRVNRLLEPFMWHTAIVTSTEWSNFFGLRYHKAAQPEFYELAEFMFQSYEESRPAQLGYGFWHLPLVSLEEIVETVNKLGEHQAWPLLIKISVSRCARVSYDKHADDEPLENTLSRYDKLKASGHLSPFEHAARPFTSSEWTGRKMLQHKVHKLDFIPSLTRERIAESLEFDGNFRGWTQHRKEIPFESDFNLAQAAAA